MINGTPVSMSHNTQLVYRELLGSKKVDRERVSELADRAGLPTLNEVVVRQAAVAAWKAMRDPSSPFASLVKLADARTRSNAQEHVQPVSVRCLAARNISAVWNASEDLRNVSSPTGAKRVAKKLAEQHRRAALAA